MTGYEVRSSNVTHRGALSDVRVDEVAMPDGSVGEREVVEHDDAVAVVPVHPDGSVTLIRHYRHPFSRKLLEIPAGKLDVDGEPAVEAARRELLEEVALEAGPLVELITFENSAGWSDETTTVYLARDVRPGAPPDDFVAADEEADITVERMPLSEAVGMVLTGAITDAKTVIGLLLADRHMANDAGEATS